MSCHWSNCYYVPSTLLNIFQAVCHSVLMAIVWGRHNCPHFKKWETKAERGKGLAGVSTASGTDSLETSGSGPPSHALNHSAISCLCVSRTTWLQGGGMLMPHSNFLSGARPTCSPPIFSKKGSWGLGVESCVLGSCNNSSFPPSIAVHFKKLLQLPPSALA